MKSIEILNTDTYTQEVIDRLSDLLTKRDTARPFHFFLSGGSTPKAVYAGLAEKNIDWSNLHFWWGDERFVPPDHADSNYRMVKEQLLAKIDLPALQVHPWPILSTPELSAETYDREFRSFFNSPNHTLDIQLLGLGDDGHTASLFPNSSALEESEHMCVANHVEGKESVRLSLTYPALAKSRRVIFLIRGAGKASAVREVLEENAHPAAKVLGREQTEFWLDKEAAGALSEQVRK